ncbi:MAG: adenylosuccinate synthetase, partial [Candidatus Bathyarchaeota archaeon]|nr:adenylosuccinate synthetase [Candidatus Bathyarchaeota archaeon]
TGRPRRCGWFDLVPVTYSIRVNGISELALTKLDVLSGINPIRLCLHYKSEDEIITEISADLKMYEKCIPVYEELEGWPSSVEWSKVAQEGYDALPQQAKAYIERIQELVRVPIKTISVGPERKDTIVTED